MVPGKQQSVYARFLVQEIRIPIPAALSILNSNFKGLDQPLLTRKKQPGIKHSGLSSLMQKALPYTQRIGVPPR